MKQIIFIFLILPISLFSQIILKNSYGSYLINGETLSIKFKNLNSQIVLSESQKEKEVKEIFKSNKKYIIFRDNVKIVFLLEKDHLYVKSSGEKGEIVFPKISSANELILPLKEGKRVPLNDLVWEKHLENILSHSKGISTFSMNFFSVKIDKFYPTYIYDNSFYNYLDFKNKTLYFTHKFQELSKNKEITFKIYPNVLSLSKSAKMYREYLIENNKFKTLKEKSLKNKNIEKLYGASHFYLAGDSFFSIEDIKNWKKFINIFNIQLKNESSIFYKYEIINLKGFGELKTLIKETNNGKNINKYLKNSITRVLNELLYKTCIDNNIFSYKKVLKLKDDFYIEFKDSLNSYGYLGEGNSMEILDNLKKLGIEKSWLGFHNYMMGVINPKFVEKANNMGYLIAPYDSYKSIHLKGKEKWNTASFRDEKLYETGIITNKKNKPIKGFNGVGRELNPKFSFNEVKFRMDIFSKLEFNSWFIDTDGVGEVYDDYKHRLGEEDQINLRIKRLDLIKNKYNMVIGTEDGDDFVAETVSYAHGMFTGIVPWWDFKEMMNKKSKYYMGKYLSSYGGVPEYFSKEIVLPKKADYLYYNEKFNIPLYQLVYNDSIIGTHHWIFHTLKIKDRQRDVMLREILYNVPPMYHLDRKTLHEKGDIISKHSNFFSSIHKQLINCEMLSFEYLNNNNLFQKTKFSNGTEIISNFSNLDLYYKNLKINKKSLIIIKKNKIAYYTPAVSKI